MHISAARSVIFSLLSFVLVACDAAPFEEGQRVWVDLPTGTFRADGHVEGVVVSAAEDNVAVQINKLLLPKAGEQAENLKLGNRVYFPIKNVSAISEGKASWEKKQEIYKLFDSGASLDTVKPMAIESSFDEAITAVAIIEAAVETADRINESDKLVEKVEAYRQGVEKLRQLSAPFADAPLPEENIALFTLAFKATQMHLWGVQLARSVTPSTKNVVADLSRSGDNLVELIHRYAPSVRRNFSKGTIRANAEAVLR